MAEISETKMSFSADKTVVEKVEKGDMGVVIYTGTTESLFCRSHAVLKNDKLK